MTRPEIDAALREELHRIAPDIDVEEIDRGAELREETDIDSMDFLNLVTALGRRLDMDIPEADYDELQSYDAMLAYLANRVG
jgi:acyl carrier protein